MLNIGSSEFFLLGVLFLLLFGPEKLPEIARAFGQAYRAFRLHSQAMTDELRRQLEMETAARSMAQAPAAKKEDFSFSLPGPEERGDGDPPPLESKPMALVLPRNSEGSDSIPEASNGAAADKPPAAENLITKKPVTDKPEGPKGEASPLQAHSLGDGFGQT